MKPAILFVDDEPTVLDVLRRQLRHQFTVETAQTGDEALATIRQHGPFAAVVADYRMPRMSGVDLLVTVREVAPDTVRVVMTGQCDMEAAVSAINEGHIFRFLTKPCPTVTLVKVLQGCVAQYRLQHAERELLEKTLSGSVRVLSDILSLVSPEAFGRAGRLKDCVVHVVKALTLPDAWQDQVAALLSQIGCITLPGDTIAKMINDLPMSNSDRETIAAHPGVARSLLAHIPRLESVAQMIALQRAPLPPGARTREELLREPAEIVGARLLHVALAVDQRMLHGRSVSEAVTDLRRSANEFGPVLVEALERFAARRAGTRVEAAFVRDLKTLMVLDEDVRTRDGLLLVSRGQQVTVAVIQRLRSFARGVGVAEPFRVRIPDDPALPDPIDPGPAASSLRVAPSPDPG